MGDRYFLTVKCAACGHTDEDVYYAPTCGLVDHVCHNCGHVTDLEAYSGITYADASNADVIEVLINAIDASAH